MNDEKITYLSKEYKVIGTLTTKPEINDDGTELHKSQVYGVIEITKFNTTGNVYYVTDRLHETHDDGTEEPAVIAEWFVESYEPLASCVVCSSPAEGSRLGHAVCGLCRTHPMIAGLGISRS